MKIQKLGLSMALVGASLLSMASAQAYDAEVCEANKKALAATQMVLSAESVMVTAYDGSGYSNGLIISSGDDGLSLKLAYNSQLNSEPTPLVSIDDREFENLFAAQQVLQQQVLRARETGKKILLTFENIQTYRRCATPHPTHMTPNVSARELVKLFKVID